VFKYKGGALMPIGETGGIEDEPTADGGWLI
jgi:hypothetical protein